MTTKRKIYSNSGKYMATFRESISYNGKSYKLIKQFKGNKRKALDNAYKLEDKFKDRGFSTVVISRDEAIYLYVSK